MNEEHLLTELLAELADGHDLPSPSLRGRVLTRARRRREPAPAFAEPYAAQVSVLDALLAELGHDDWPAPVIYGWSVRDLVEHLAAVDGIVTEALQDPSTAFTQADLDRRTAQAQASPRTPEQTRRHWREQSAALCAGLFDRPADLPTRAPVPLPLRDLITARAFETWVHGTDIAAAVGRTLLPPLPHHLHPIADLGVRLLPDAHHAATGTPTAGSARIILDGPGGGDWIIELAPGGPPGPLVALELDVVDFCLLVGDRRDPTALAFTATGDEPLARSLLAAAPAFAVP